MIFGMSKVFRIIQSKCRLLLTVFIVFSVSPVTAAEVTWFNLDWKVPCVLFYQNKALCDNNSYNEKSALSALWNGESNFTPIANKIFLDDGRIAATSKVTTFTPLTKHEMPKSGIKVVEHR